MGSGDDIKKGVLGAFGMAVSKAGELGTKAGGAIKDFAESDTAEKMADGVKKGAKAAANGVVKGAKLAADGIATGTQKAVENIKETAEETAKKKEEKKELRKEIKAELAAEKERSKGDRTDESNHTVLELKRSGIRLLIPDGYEKLKGGKTGDSRVDKANEKLFYVKAVSTCNGCIIIFDTSAEESMDFNNKQGIIDGIHECMNERQGVICVESGKTSRGYDYIYSIVKTLRDETFAGVGYFLRMNICNDGKIIEIQGFFDEARYTGMRESFTQDLAHRAGVKEYGSFEGWSEDPYDPGYTKGVPMNLAERIGLDGFFPDNPLSQTRELVRAVLFDEIMEDIEGGSLYKEKDEPDPNISEEEKDRVEVKQREYEREMLLPLFDKGENCKRPRYTVYVK